jgi:hypothetical protein
MNCHEYTLQYADRLPACTPAIPVTLLLPGWALADASPVDLASEDVPEMVIVPAGRETHSAVTLSDA